MIAAARTAPTAAHAGAAASRSQRRYRRAMTRGVGHCLTVAARAAAPRKIVSVSEHADEHRELSTKQSGESGRWRTSRTPFLREIMDCMSATSSVTDIWIMKSSQVGVTECIINWICYIMALALGPSMVLMPTIELRDRWKKQKLNPLFLETPIIRELLGGQRSRDASNSADLIDFPGGLLALAGGNSPNSYSQVSVRNLVLDDLDRFPAEIGAEGDPVLLAKGRTKAFARPKRVFISTPTVHGESLIERGYLESDQRRYHVPCPHCGEFQALEWGGPEKPYGIKFNADISTAWYLCKHCACEIYEHQKPNMIRDGRWIADAPHIKTRGYHLTALLAPIGLGPSWLDLAREWQTARKSPNTLRTFINTHLGEAWTEPGTTIEPTGLIARREIYPAPLPLLAKTAGVDVQKDRLEVSIVGWREQEEAFIVDHIIIPGDTARPEVWVELADVFADTKPEAAAIDSGYNASMVYAFCERTSYAYAVKGVAGPGRPIVESEKSRNQRLRRQRKKGIQVHMVGDDQAKALIYARLQMIEPGPGYIHFPNTESFDDEYFAQLTAEKLITKIRGTRPIAEWVQTRPRNETLDCLKYALAALRLSSIDLAARAARLKKPPVTAAPPPQKTGFVKGWKR